MKQLLVAAILVFLAGCDTNNSASTPPVPEVGVVRGQLVYEDTGEGVATTVKLFPVDIGDDGSSFIFSPEMVEHIRSLRTTAGGFLFDDVTPGTYLLAIELGGWGPQYPTNDQGEQIALQVEAGQDLDLGEVRVKVQ